MGRCCWDGGWKWWVRCGCVGALLLAGWGSTLQAQTPGDEDPGVQAEAMEPEGEEVADEAPPVAEASERVADNALENDFSSYLHFALIGQFDIADRYAEALLKNPDLAPLSEAGARQLLDLTDRYKDSIDVLLLIINNTSIADNARKILDLIRAAHLGERQNPARISESIRFLAGTPTQQATAMERLLESGEYAVPWLLTALTDPAQADLRPFVVKALPELGKRALNPLIAALDMGNPVLQRLVVDALGKIGYPQSLPYLKRLATDPKTNEAVRQAAATAMRQLVVPEPAILDRPAAVLLAELAEQYYADIESLQPDPREDRANVWVARQDMVAPIEVPRDIFSLVMCMRSCEQSLALRQDQSEVVALWLAANFRREARLGLDVQAEEVAQTADLTRPGDFLRSVYFARCAGPVHSQMVLRRAIRNRDREVALGAIAALNRVAGPAAMVGTDSAPDMSLAAALRFPDLLVRTKAALALAHALPGGVFRGADEVVPILASALGLTGQRYYLLVDPDEAGRKNLADGLQKTGAEVLAGDRLNTILARAHQERTYLDGIFLASNLAHPSLIEAIRTLAEDARFGLVPIVVYIKEGDAPVLDRLAELERRVGHVLVADENGPTAPGFAELLLEKHAQVAAAARMHELDEEASEALALDAAQALLRIARSGSPIFNVGMAEPTLTAALGHPSETLRMTVLKVLAELPTAPAQQAIASVALAEDHSDDLRKVAFAALAESARQGGPKLEPAMIQRLTQQAFAGPDLEIRTAASAALGAINLPGDQAAQIILQSRAN